MCYVGSGLLAGQGGDSTDHVPTDPERKFYFSRFLVLRGVTILDRDSSLVASVLWVRAVPFQEWGVFKWDRGGYGVYFSYPSRVRVEVEVGVDFLEPAPRYIAILHFYPFSY